MDDLCICTNRKRSSCETKYFQRKYFQPSSAAEVSIVCGTNNHVKSEMLSNTQTHRHTQTQTKYCNPRCACTPRVNELRLDNTYVHAGDISCLLFVSANE